MIGPALFLIFSIIVLSNFCLWALTYKPLINFGRVRWKEYMYCLINNYSTPISYVEWWFWNEYLNWSVWLNNFIRNLEKTLMHSMILIPDLTSDESSLE